MFEATVLGDDGLYPVHKVVESAKEIGGLDGNTLLAFICLILFAYIVYLIKQGRTSDKAWQDIRLREAVADQKLADAVGSLSKDVCEMKIILSLKRGT